MEIIGRSYMLITSGSQRVNNWFEYYFIISLYIYIYIYIYIYVYISCKSCVVVKILVD